MTGQPGSGLSSSEQLSAWRELTLSLETAAPPFRYGTGFLCSAGLPHITGPGTPSGLKIRLILYWKTMHVSPLTRRFPRLPVPPHLVVLTSQGAVPCLRVRGSHADHLPCPRGLGAEGSRSLSSMCHGPEAAAAWSAAGPSRGVMWWNVHVHTGFRDSARNTTGRCPGPWVLGTEADGKHIL